MHVKTALKSQERRAFGGFGDLKTRLEGTVASSTEKVRAKATRAKIPERRARAFRAYLDVLDTAAWFRHRAERQLEEFDLNLERFRMMEILYTEGPKTMPEMAARRNCGRQGQFGLAQPLIEKGWVRLEAVRVHVADGDAGGTEEIEPGPGRRVTRMHLTAEGQEFMAVVMRRHAKLIYALMKVVDPREMDRLSRSCRRIREGDSLKLIRELMMEDYE